MKLHARYFCLLAVVLVVVLVIIARPGLKRHIESVKCSDQMHVILEVSTLMWPDDHEGHLPSDFLSMSNELMMTKILVCPADHSRHPAENWSSFSADHCSYEIVTRGLRKADTTNVFLRCRFHGYTGYADDRLLDASGKLVRPNRLW